MILRKRGGFTLIELLVVIAIIAVLIALLLPAVQAAREAARRTQCLNSMSQIQLALSNYELSHESLPSGVVNDSGPVLDVEQGYKVGWLVQILPHLEQNNLYTRFNFKNGVYSGANGTVVEVVLNTLICPSDPQGRGALSSYVGCHHGVEAPIDSDNNGVLFLNSSIRTERIPDGSTHTLLLGETVLDSSMRTWAAGTHDTLRNTGSPPNGPMTVRSGSPGAPPPQPTTYVGGFSSYHPGGVNHAFANGSARFITNSVDVEVYTKLGNRNDGAIGVRY